MKIKAVSWQNKLLLSAHCRWPDLVHTNKFRAKARHAPEKKLQSWTVKLRTVAALCCCNRAETQHNQEINSSSSCRCCYAPNSSLERGRPTSKHTPIRTTEQRQQFEGYRKLTNWPNQFWLKPNFSHNLICSYVIHSERDPKDWKFNH
jgi:hypothetical protein